MIWKRLRWVALALLLAVVASRLLRRGVRPEAVRALEEAVQGAAVDLANAKAEARKEVARREAEKAAARTRAERLRAELADAARRRGDRSPDRERHRD